MKKRKGLAKTIADALRGYVAGEQVDEIIKVVRNHALAAGACSGVSQTVPGASLAASAVAIGFTLTMYYRICNVLGIKIGKAKLKTVASILTAETAASLGILVVANTVLGLVPGLNLPGAALGAAVNFAVVYAAGVLFLLMMARIFKLAGGMKAVENMSEAEFKKVAKSVAKKETKNIAQQAHAEHDQIKNDSAYSGDNIEPTMD